MGVEISVEFEQRRQLALGGVVDRIGGGGGGGHEDHRGEEDTQHGGQLWRGGGGKASYPRIVIPALCGDPRCFGR